MAERAGDDVQALAALTVDLLATLGGHGAGRATDIPRLLESVALTSPASGETLHRLAVFCLWNEDHASARTLLERLVELAHAGPRTLLPLALDTLAALDLRTRRWPAAEGRSAEALRLALELGQDWVAASCNTTLAAIAASTGREEECRKRVHVALELAPGSELVLAWGVTSLALLELLLDRPGAAIAEVEKIAGVHRLGTSVAPLLPLQVEAHVREGRVADASTALEALETRAAGSRHVGTLALAARCRGLLAGTRTYRAHFEEALELHTHLPTPFERARTELLFGERLRRGRHRAEALPVLPAALATFERIGAVKWGERARRELAACVAARQGPTRSPICAKLSIRSRTELAHLVLRA